MNDAWKRDGDLPLGAFEAAQFQSLSLPLSLAPSPSQSLKTYPRMMCGGKGDSPGVRGGAVCLGGVGVGREGGVVEEEEEEGTVVGVSSTMLLVVLLLTACC